MSQPIARTLAIPFAIAAALLLGTATAPALLAAPAPEPPAIETTTEAAAGPSLGTLEAVPIQAQAPEGERADLPRSLRAAKDAADAAEARVPGAARLGPSAARAKTGPTRDIGAHGREAALVKPVDSSVDSSVNTEAETAVQTGPRLQRLWPAFDGASSTWHPGNPTIATDGELVLAGANAAFDLFDRDGVPLEPGPPIQLDAWFQSELGLAEDVSVFGPRALYDADGDRLVLAALGNRIADGTSYLLFTVFGAQSSCSYALATDQVAGERLGLMAENLQAVANRDALAFTFDHYEFVDNGRGDWGDFVESRALFVDKDDVYPAACGAQEASAMTWRVTDGDGRAFQGVMPAQALGADAGPQRMYFLHTEPEAGDRITLWTATTQGEGSVIEEGPRVISIPVDGFAAPPNAPQRGTASPLFTGWASLSNAVLDGNTLWASQLVACAAHAGSCVRWYRIDASGLLLEDADEFGAADGSDLLLPALMPDGQGLPMIAYGRVSSDEFVGLGVTDPLPDTPLHDIPGMAGEGCLVQQKGQPALFGPQTAITRDPLRGTVWVHGSTVAGGSPFCDENVWRTAVLEIDWERDAAPEPTPEPTAEPTPAPEPGAPTKGIGFALASKRFMRGVYGPEGLSARRGAMRGTASTGIQVQNTDGQRNSFPFLNFVEQRLPYGPDTGEPFVRDVDMSSIAPGRSLNAYLPALDIVDAMYRVAVVTPAEGGDISAIARTDWDTGGAAIVSNLGFARRIVIPHVARDFQSRSSVIALSNAGTSEAEVTIRLYREGSGQEVASKRLWIPGAEALTFDLQDADPAFEALGTGFRGSAIVEVEDGRVGAQVYEYVEDSELAIGGFEGMPAESAASRLLVPLFRAGQRGPGGIRLDTEIAVANAGGRAAEVTVTYYPTANDSASAACRASGPVVHGPLTVPAGSSRIFGQGPGGGHGLPEDCFGSAVVAGADAADRLAATILDTQNGDETLSAMNASPQALASDTVALPLFRSKHLVDEYTTGIQVMNAGTEPARVHVDFSRTEGNTTVPISGCRGQCDATIAPNESFTWWPPAVDAIPADTYGAAVLSSDQPILVLVNDYPLRGRSDMATYEGIAVTTTP